MAISSVSKVFVAPDPIMETDLELMAKVNSYQQTKFDTGAEALQQEVNNWALMTQIAKPELRQYANAKLLNLVDGIANMGGVNLSDINNVNSLKAMGYNIYGDQRIMDGVQTTQRMKQLQSDASKKLSGKDAAKYDNTVSAYLQKGYAEWANDGDVNNTKYEGPTELPMGNMNLINEKVKSYLKELTPDSDSAPSGDLQKSYGYFQIDGKWLKGDRIREAIDAVTDENDQLVFKAHGWGALRGDTEQGLKNKFGLLYDNTSSTIKGQINNLQTQLNNASDAATKLQLQNLIQQQKTALAENEKEKLAVLNQPQLTGQQREELQGSLYRNAWETNFINSFAYRQEKKDFKANMPLIYHDRMEIQAQQWAADYKLRVANYELDKFKTIAEVDKMRSEMGDGAFGSGSGVPLNQVPITDEANQQKSPEKMINQFNTEFFKASYDYNKYLYNLVGANDTAGRFENVNGEWIPKPEYKQQADKEVADLAAKLDNYSNLSDAERIELDKFLPTDADEKKALFRQRATMTGLKAFSKMARDKETEILNAAKATGKIDFDYRDVQVNGGERVEDVLAKLEAGLYKEDTPINSIQVNSNTGMAYFEDNDFFPTTVETVGDLKKGVAKMKKSIEDSYIKAGGSMFNSYEVPIPFVRLSKAQQEIVQKQIASKVGTDNSETVNPLSGRIEYDFQTNSPKYLLNVEYKKGTKQQTPVEIDISDIVKSNLNNSSFGIHTAFPKADITHAWGLSLAKDGSTPFVQSDNYKDAIRTVTDNYPFQVSVIRNSVNGTNGAKVKIALPVGGGKTVEVNVKNLKTNSYTFPPYVELIQQYFETVMSTPEDKARFYKEHGLEMPK